MKLATGLPTAEPGDKLLEHAAQCAPCAGLLQTALDVASGDATEAEQVFLEDLGRAREAARPVGGRRPPPLPRWLAWAAAVVLAAGLGVWWQARRAGGAAGYPAELARIYTAHREFEPRIPGAGHAPLAATRSAAGTRTPEHLEAAARLARQLRDQPDQPDLLAAKGRLELLLLNPPAAVEALKSARDLGLDTHDVAIDLATAYYLRGRQNQNTADLTLAVDILSRVIQADPRNATALFNRAIVEAELQLLDPAIEDLEKAIAAETSAGWKQEAQQRLVALKARKQGLFQATPEQLGEQVAEVALEQAMRNAALMTNPAGPPLKALAQRMQREHGDAWLADMNALRRRQPETEAALAVLSRMAGIRTRSAIAEYQKATAAFAALRNLPEPLEAWRRLEEWYRATRLREQYACPSTSGNSASDLVSARYPWLRIQVERERASCEYLNQKAAPAQQRLAAAADLADRHNYAVSSVRIRTLLANLESRHGNFREALNQARRQIDRVIGERLPVQRSHEYFNILMLTAARLNRLHAARRAAFMAATTAQAAGFDSLYFSNLSYWSELAHRCGEVDEARRVLNEALRSYDASGGSITSPGWHAWTQMNLAQIRSEPRLLAPYEQMLDRSPDPRLWLPFQRVKAGFELAAGQKQQARLRLEKAIQFASKGAVWQCGRCGVAR